MSFKKLISFPSIEQFRNIVVSVHRRANFVGLDENGGAVYDDNRPKPVLTFVGTVKLHGTNFGICYNMVDGIWAQSKESIITPQNDNAGSAFFVDANKGAFLDLFSEVIDRYGIDPTKNTIAIYAEWVGKGIQKGVAINNIDKSAFIIGLKIAPHPKDGEDIPVSYWLNHSFLKKPENRIYNIMDYKTYSITIDFNDPQSAIPILDEILDEVEDECPVGKAFGYSGIGEGVVFVGTNSDGTRYLFKHKGEKHSKASKVKVLKPVDDVKMNKVIEVVNTVCKSWRLEQALDKTFDLMNGGELDIKKLGDFIRNVINDIIKEESDIIAGAGLIPKDINSKVSEISRNFFMDKLNESVGLN